jgi:hypothetical protein
MEHTKYKAAVEEGLTIKRRSRADQTRLMVIFRAMDEDQCLAQYCDDIGYTEKAAQNYLKAYETYMDMGVVPEHADLDAPLSPAVIEMWLEVFDATLDGRYGYSGVDREGIDAASKEAGLKGPSKAYDIAKNPNSMTVAILGDDRCAQAATKAVLRAAALNPELRDVLQEGILDLWHDDGTDSMVGGSSGGGGRFGLSDRDRVWKLYDKLDKDARRVYDFEVPDYLIDLSLERARRIHGLVGETIVILEGRKAIEAAV